MVELKMLFTLNTNKIKGFNSYELDRDGIGNYLQWGSGVGKGSLTTRAFVQALSPRLKNSTTDTLDGTHYKIMRKTVLNGNEKQSEEFTRQIIPHMFNIGSPEIQYRSLVGVVSLNTDGNTSIAITHVNKEFKDEVDYLKRTFLILPKELNPSGFFEKMVNSIQDGEESVDSFLDNFRKEYTELKMDCQYSKNSKSLFCNRQKGKANYFIAKSSELNEIIQKAFLSKDTSSISDGYINKMIDTVISDENLATTKEAITEFKESVGKIIKYKSSNKTEIARQINLLKEPLEGIEEEDFNQTETQISKKIQIVKIQISNEKDKLKDEIQYATNEIPKLEQKKHLIDEKITNNSNELTKASEITKVLFDKRGEKFKDHSSVRTEQDEVKKETNRIESDLLEKKSLFAENPERELERLKNNKLLKTLEIENLQSSVDDSKRKIQNLEEESSNVETYLTTRTKELLTIRNFFENVPVLSPPKITKAHTFSLNKIILLIKAISKDFLNNQEEFEEKIGNSTKRTPSEINDEIKLQTNLLKANEENIEKQSLEKNKIVIKLKEAKNYLDGRDKEELNRSIDELNKRFEESKRNEDFINKFMSKINEARKVVELDGSDLPLLLKRYSEEFQKMEQNQKDYKKDYEKNSILLKETNETIDTSEKRIVDLKEFESKDTMNNYSNFETEIDTILDEVDLEKTIDILIVEIENEDIELNEGTTYLKNYIRERMDVEENNTFNIILRELLESFSDNSFYETILSIKDDIGSLEEKFELVKETESGISIFLRNSMYEMMSIKESTLKGIPKEIKKMNRKFKKIKTKMGNYNQIQTLGERKIEDDQDYRYYGGNNNVTPDFLWGPLNDILNKTNIFIDEERDVISKGKDSEKEERILNIISNNWKLFKSSELEELNNFLEGVLSKNFDTEFRRKLKANSNRIFELKIHSDKNGLTEGSNGQSLVLNTMLLIDDLGKYSDRIKNIPLVVDEVNKSNREDLREAISVINEAPGGISLFFTQQGHLSSEFEECFLIHKSQPIDGEDRFISRCTGEAGEANV